MVAARWSALALVFSGVARACEGRNPVQPRIPMAGVYEV